MKNKIESTKIKNLKKSLTIKVILLNNVSLILTPTSVSSIIYLITGNVYQILTSPINLKKKPLPEENSNYHTTN